MKTMTSIRAGKLSANHNQRRAAALRIRTGLKAGTNHDGVRLNHNQTRVQA